MPGADVAWDDMPARRRWIELFRERPLTPDDVQISFSRSSGPGGQNVNKLNTKVDARLVLGGRTPLALPAELVRALAKQSVSIGRIAALTGQPFYVQSSHVLLATSGRYRTQSQNLDDALQKLHAEVVRIAALGLRNETPPEQQRRVQKLQEAEKRRKVEMKKMRSMTKSGRRAKP